MNRRLTSSAFIPGRGIVLLLIIFLASCNTVEPPPGEKPTLLLKLEDVSCTEAWIELTTTNLQLPATVTIKQTNPNGDTKSQIINLNTKDSLLYIDSLLPNQTYKFQAISQSSNQSIKSNEITVSTMDTTSHDFTFQSWTFGTIGSSTLYDVAIINENNIWAVGEIMIADTSINGYTTYNAVHWDGSKWELKRILYQGGFWVIRTIFAFNENDIWFSAFVRYDGQNFIELPIPPILIGWSINKIWGSSSNDLYVVGNNGNIARYNNSTWSRIESGTELNINDIWGEYNEKTGEWEILAVASNVFINQDKKVLQITGTAVKEIYNGGLPWALSTIWFIASKKYLIGGDGLYTTRYLGENWIRDYNVPPYYKTSIRGTSFNDIIMVGAFGLLIHFNGVSWYNFQEIFSGSYGSINKKGNTVAIVGGLNDGKAIVTIGNK